MHTPALLGRTGAHVRHAFAQVCPPTGSTREQTRSVNTKHLLADVGRHNPRGRDPVIATMTSFLPFEKGSAFPSWADASSCG
jgi:hypothetical protein